MEIQLNQSPTDTIRKLWRFPKEADKEVDLENVRSHLKLKAERRNRNAPSQLVYLKEGDLVLVKANPVSSAADAVIKKFFFVYEGPYEIGKVLREDVFVLVYPANGKERGTFHINLLKPYQQRYSSQPDELAANSSTTEVSEFAGEGQL